MEKLLIKNGILIDKANGYHCEPADILVEGGVIKTIGKDLAVDGCEVIDAEGKYVSAGLIDVHVHNRLRGGVQAQTGLKEFSFDSVDELGVDRGCSTVIECGSVPVCEVEDFVKESDAAKTRYYGLLSAHSETAFGGRAENDVEKINPEHYYEVVEKHPGYIKGLKLACSKTATGDQGYALLKKGKEICRHLGLPMTIHVGNFPPDPNGLIEFMEAGDVVTHTYHGKEVSLFKEDGTPKKSMERARRRGVIFDVGHGTASFDVTVYDKAFRKGFYPDIISTDLRGINANGPVWSLATVMSKVMNLGMSLEDVVNANTYNAANVYHLDNLGQIKPGYFGDFTIFDVQDVDYELEDCYFHMQKITKLIHPVKTIVSKNGGSEIYDCIELFK